MWKYLQRWPHIEKIVWENIHMQFDQSYTGMKIVINGACAEVSDNHKYGCCLQFVYSLYQ